MKIELFIHVNSVYLYLFKYNVLIIIRTVIKSDALAIRSYYYAVMVFVFTHPTA